MSNLKQKIAARNKLLNDTSLIGKNEATKKKVAKKPAATGPKRKVFKKRPY